MKLYLTDKGREILYKAQGGQQLNFSKFVVGDGELGSQVIQTLTNVINDKMNLNISKIDVRSNKVVIGTYLTNSDLEEGFYFRELGLYANDPETQEEVLYMYANAGESAEYIDSKEGDIIEEYLDVNVVVSNVADITAIIDESLVYVTDKEFKEHKDNTNIHITEEERANWNNKAASTHNHSASDINSGTLGSDRLPTVPITKGGTGATTAAQALINLGLTATAAELNKMDGITASTTELNYIKGVTSAIQTQINGKAASSHNQSASTITAGTLAGKVNANATAKATLTDSQVRDIKASTTDLTAGTSTLTTGDIYLVYE